jgi:hypothetical protein
LAKKDYGKAADILTAIADGITRTDYAMPDLLHVDRAVGDADAAAVQQLRVYIERSTRHTLCEAMAKAQREAFESVKATFDRFCANNPGSKRFADEILSGKARLLAADEEAANAAKADAPDALRVAEELRASSAELRVLHNSRIELQRLSSLFMGSDAEGDGALLDALSSSARDAASSPVWAKLERRKHVLAAAIAYIDPAADAPTEVPPPALDLGPLKEALALEDSAGDIFAPVRSLVTIACEPPSASAEQIQKLNAEIKELEDNLSEGYEEEANQLIAEIRDMANNLASWSRAAFLVDKRAQCDDAVGALRGMEDELRDRREAGTRLHRIMLWIDRKTAAPRAA